MDNQSKISDIEKTVVKSFFLRIPGHSNLKQVADSTGINQRTVTSIVQELRKEGVPILSSRKNGFWFSDDEQEIIDFITEWENETKRRFLTIKELKRKYIKEPKKLFQKLFNI